jgi:molybdate transport system ATP-binding protein
VVFQDGRLFPHLSLVDNVAFGLRCRGARRAAARREAHGWLDRVGLADRAGDAPATLSGGQAQLVALARALATNPRLLLLDEPLSALDAQVRPAVRADLQRQLATFAGSRLLVTHDPVEALVLADRLVVVEDGVVVQDGPPDEVRRRPRTAYAASVVGLNLWSGRGVGGRFVLEGGGHLVAAAPAPDGACLAVVSPAAVALHRERPEGSPRNVVEGLVAGVEPRGGLVRVQVDGSLPLVAEITAGAAAELGMAPGRPVWASIKASEIAISPA